MFYKLLILFIGLPAIEIMILIKLGETLGFWAAFSLVIVTGVLGAALARLEGARTFFEIQNALKAGEMPAEKMIDAFLILIAGFFLITPGMLTDITGLLLLVPQFRYWVKRWLRKKFDEMIQRSQEPGYASGDFRLFLR